MADNTQANICCPNLEVIECADTKEHKHLVCGFSHAILVNQTIIEMCIGNHEKCVLLK